MGKAYKLKTWLTDSDLVKVDVSGDWDFTIDLPLIPQQHGEFGTQTPQCVPKSIGSLSFTVLASELNLNLPFDLPVALSVQGSDAGTDTNGNLRIRWEVNQALAVRIPAAVIQEILAEQGVDIPVPGDGIVDSVNGEILVVLKPVACLADDSGRTPLPEDPECDPKRLDGDPLCGGDCHRQAVHFEVADGLANQITFRGHLDAPVQIGATAVVRPKIFSGVASTPLSIDLLVYSPSGGCYSNLEGTTEEWYLGGIIGQPVGEIPTIRWEVLGATSPPSTPTDQFRFKIEVPTSPEVYVVTLTVTFGTCTIKKRWSRRATSKEEAERKFFYCKAIERILGYIHVDPSSDPLGPDDPFRKLDPAHLRETAQLLIEVADRIAPRRG